MSPLIDVVEQNFDYLSDSDSDTEWEQVPSDIPTSEGPIQTTRMEEFSSSLVSSTAASMFSVIKGFTGKR